MTNADHFRLALLAITLFATANSVCAAQQASGDIVFERDIQPLFTEHCAECHGGVQKSGGFSVLGRDLILNATDSGQAAVEPGSADTSELMRRVLSNDPDERMPPDAHDPLTPRQIALLRNWIDSGAEWPQHWAWSPFAEHTGLAANDGSVIDALIQTELSDREIEPASPAERRTLIRRLSLDLLGLLPTVSETQAFVDDDSPDAWQRLVDRMLASEHFGERWGRHWLDEARYADSEGYEKDTPKADAYRFRDWVIHAINDDMPFDQFTVRLIAGDLLPNRTNDDLIATKFHLQTQFNLEGGVDAEEDRTKRVIDQINTVGTVWLGISIGCCQCHDHPYDSLSQEDFYGLYAFFNNTDLSATLLDNDDEKSDGKRKERAGKWNTVSDLIDRQVHDKNLSNSVQGKLSQLRNFDNTNGFTRFLAERTTDRRTTFAFHRGDFLQPDVEKGEVAPTTPRALPPLHSRSATADRLDLAHWLVQDANPVVARVTVNKVWMHLFGKPLVDQPQDFGSRGGVSSHPELLEWLARWFVVEGQWSRKELIRLIVNSGTYRQSSDVRSDLSTIDPDNHLLARQNRFRVEAEIIRDIALQASGLLTDRVGGPSVFPPLPPIIARQTYANSNKYKVSTGDNRYRRGLYTFFRRTAIDPNLLTFDCPDSSITRAERDHSNNPLQALALLHNEVFHEAAQHFAKRVLQLDTATDSARINQAFLIALGRNAVQQETDTLLALLDESRSWYAANTDAATQLTGDHAVAEYGAAENAAWVATLRIILNLDEFVTRS
jgi:mono/diheme cytochrome c family protein